MQSLAKIGINLGGGKETEKEMSKKKYLDINTTKMLQKQKS